MSERTNRTIDGMIRRALEHIETSPRSTTVYGLVDGARDERIVPLLRAIVEDAGLEDFPPLHRFDDATWVGYRMAEVLPIPHQARLRLLELDDPISRLEIIHAFLKQHKLID